MTITMRVLRRGGACVGALAMLVGCAAQPVAPAVAILHPASRLQVLELPPSVTDASLRRLFHAGTKEKIPTETVAANRQHVAQLLEDSALQ